LHSAIEALTHPFYVIDPKSYRIIMANSAANLGDLNGRLTCYAATHRRAEPCGGDEHPCPVDEIKRTKEPVTVEHIHYDQDGQPRLVQIHGYPVLDDEGNVFQIIEYCLDITERKRAEEAQRESEQRYRSLFKDSRDAIYMTARDGTFIDVNQSALDLFGYTRDEMIGLNALEIYIDPDDRQRFRQEIEQKGSVRHYEAKLRKKDGTQLDCLLAASVRLADDGSILGYQGIIHDVTDRKRLETQLHQAQKMEAVGTLAAGIAHDFNNILGVIIGYTEIAQIDLVEGTRAKAKLNEVLKAANRAKDLVNQTLTFSRQRELEPKALQLSLIVKEALKWLRASLPSTIEIRQNIKKDSGVVLADPTQMHQMLMNLCTNAAHAIREKGGVLEVSLMNVDLDAISAAQYPDIRPGRYVRLTVEDTGHGMAHEVMARIFDPYFTTKEKGVGTGLGLAVVHGIVESYRGNIVVYSEPGKGTTFHILLPRIDIKAGEEIEPIGLLPRGNERVLFVDDEEALSNIGQEMLEYFGYKVIVKTSSIEALEVFRAEPHKFDLVITDETMPGMTGKMLAKELMSIRADIPIILCTGFSELVGKEKAKTMGIREFLMKPISIHDMTTTIRKVLDKD
jgi:PAS domain S-box-containing protein